MNPLYPSVLVMLHISGTALLAESLAVPRNKVKVQVEEQTWWELKLNTHDLHDLCMIYDFLLMVP